jgi:hypothetical protein
LSSLAAEAVVVSVAAEAVDIKRLTVSVFLLHLL